MPQETPKIFDVIIIGAGQAGLSAGYFLNERKLNYIVFERGSIAESWSSQRWDSLRLDSPGWMNYLPGEIADPLTGEQFIGDEASLRVKRMVDEYIEKNAVQAGMKEDDQADEPDTDSSSAAQETELDIAG